MTAPRSPMAGPPEGFRPFIPISVKLRSALLALGIDPDNTDWDHDPPLALRLWDEQAQDTRPPANDPRYLRPRSRADHRAKTAKQDIPAIAKTKRLTAEQETFRRNILRKEPGQPREQKSRIKSRGFARRKERA